MVVEELLQFLVGEVDTELLKAVVLPFFAFTVRRRAIGIRGQKTVDRRTE